ncbi:NAD(P)-dependent oxidoreductase [Streptomyces axinellae]|uniref:3-hydroxyisobutyrate dehydrogenase n=1 Tax=Streptomyces axinellae TaxID=552788 RepID=A0ABP6DFY2_9ACTN
MVELALYGLGEMGSDIARCLAGRGVRLHAYDPVAEVEVDGEGFQRHDSARDAARTASVHLIVLKHRADVEALLFGAEGVCASAPPESLLILHTTLTPEAVRELHARTREGHGHTLIDAALSRRGGAVSDGSLSLFTGADEVAFARAQPVLEHYADNVVHAGDVGAGMTVKLCNNWLLYSNRHAALQAIRTGRELGVDPGVLRESLASSTGASWALTHYSDLDEGIVTGQGAPAVVRDRTASELGMAREMATRGGTVPSSLQETFALLEVM